MTESTVTLAYAELPSKWGVTSDRQPDRLRIVVPPVPSWRYLHPGYFLGILPLALAIGMWVTAQRTHDMRTMLPSIGMHTLVFLFIILKALYRLHTRTIIDVTQHQLSITTNTAFIRSANTTWRKSEIGDIKLNPNNGKLFLRITGKNMPEYYISPNRQVTEWVVDQVRNTAFNSDFQDSTQISRPTPSVTRVRPISIRLAAVAICATFASGIVLICLHAAAPFGAVLLVGSVVEFVVAAGVFVGTQEKKFFT